jgi:hypothetical protein
MSCVRGLSFVLDLACIHPSERKTLHIFKEQLMDESQELIGKAKQETGLADRHIADFCGVSRGHINRVKCGKDRGSEELVKSLKWLLQEHHDEPFTPNRKPYQWKRHIAKKHTTPARVQSVNYPSTQQISSATVQATAYNPLTTPTIHPIENTPFIPYSPPAYVPTTTPTAQETIDVDYLITALHGTEKWTYARGKLCLSCKSRVDTHAYKIDGQWAKLCPDCASLYVPGIPQKETNTTPDSHARYSYTGVSEDYL